MDFADWQVPQSIDDVSVGEAVSVILAKIVNSACIKKFEAQKLTELTTQYPRPSNCEYLTPVDSEIWNNLSRRPRTNDSVFRVFRKLFALLLCL